MLGWTIQTAEWWASVDGRRVYGSWQHVHQDDRQVYREFISWLQVRGHWSSRRAPIWLWTVYDERSRKPDLRSTGHLPKGTRGVRVELEYPPGLAVYTCFQRWCLFMGDIWGGGRAVDLIGRSHYRRLLINEAGVYRKRSKDWGSQVQAILPYIEPQWIRNVTEFTAR